MVSVNQDMSSLSTKYGIVALISVSAIIILVMAANCSGNSDKNKQGFSRHTGGARGQQYPASYGIRGATINIGAYQPSVDPTYWNQFAMTWPYSPDNGIDEQTARELLISWLKFMSKLSPNVQDAIYALFPSLQGVKSIDYYGVTGELIYSLSVIAPYLDHPEKFKNTEDVYRLLSSKAIKLFDEQINEKPQNGLYQDPKEMGWGVDVL